MKHLVFFSGGIGSYVTAKRVIAEHGKENVILLFTDTKMEDADLYRFLHEGAEKFQAELIIIEDGRTPWEVFEQEKFIGNSRISNCSKYLKQRLSKRWMRKNFKYHEVILYMGIDWSEEHRTKMPIKSWAPYEVKFPMCEEPYLTKEEMLQELKEDGIEIPRLYTLGYAHNNCGGFCVKAGLGHFKHLYKTQPELYKWHEEKEQALMKVIYEETGEKRTIIKRQKNNIKRPFSLKELREEIELDETQIDDLDIGGCGCFVEE